MRAVPFVLLLLAIAGGLRANDSVVTGEGGRVIPVQGELTTVRMVREWVKMDVYPAYYDVAAQFVFLNDGPATTVLMGFPEVGSGGINPKEFRQKTGFLSFRTTVDGQRVTATRRTAAPGPGDMGYRTYWVKRVAFAAHQQRVVRVEYRSQAGEDSSGNRWARYFFTGGNWKGKVEETKCTITLHLPGTYLVRADRNLSRNRNTFHGHWTDWEAEGSAGISYIPTIPYALTLRKGDRQTHENSPVGYDEVLSLPGKAPTPWTLPPAVLRDNVPCIAVQALLKFLDEETGVNAALPTSKQWDARSQTLTFTYRGKTIRLKPGEQTLETDQGTVTLPVAPFFVTVRQYFNGPQTYLYLPAGAVAEALGSEASYDGGHRALVLYFAEDPATGPHAPFTYYYGNGKWVTGMRRKQQHLEEIAIYEEQQPWRLDPLYTARAETTEFLAFPTPDPNNLRPTTITEERIQRDGASYRALIFDILWTKVTYLLTSEEQRTAKVKMEIPEHDGMPGQVIHLTLEQPFEGWWYITKLDLPVESSNTAQ